MIRLDLFAPPDEAASGTNAEPFTVVPPDVAAMVESPSTAGPATRPAGGESPATVEPTAVAPMPSLPPLGTGTAAVLGRVVVEVNGEPIFSDRVLRPLEPDLAARAREVDAETFRRVAAREIRAQIDQLIRAELEVAAARKNLGAQEMQVAEGLTMQWRARQITEAGGSVELARQKAIAEGTTFEERIQDEYRANLVRLFYAKRIYPRLQVNADDMRRFYDRNRDSKFSDRAAAQFRLIRVDIRKVGDRAMARQRAEELRARAVSGGDFAAIAGEYNDDARLRGLGGDVGMIDKGAFARQAVEAAVWALNPGEVTPVIEEAGSFWIAKLEERKDGRVRSFDEESVQDAIRNELRSQQLAQLRDRQREQLLQGAVVNPFPPPIDPLVEIVMQKYPIWAAAAPSGG
jgi:parvulin-like peptidyl-prolyl isomerase